MENRTIFALDIGTRSIIGVIATEIKGKLQIKAQYQLEHESRVMFDGQIHDIPKVAVGVLKVKQALEKIIGYELRQVAIAAAGRSLKTSFCRVEEKIEKNLEIDDVLVNSLEMQGIREAHQKLQVEKNEKEKIYCVGYSVVSYYLNGYSISNLVGHQGDTAGTEILATFLPESVVNSLYAVLERCNLEPVSLTLEPIAAIDITIPEEMRMLNIALVDVGAGTADIAISCDGSIGAYGMVPMAGDEISEAIGEALLVDFNTAEKIKRQLCLEQEISFQDIMGLPNTVTAEAVLSAISPIIDSLAERIAQEILKLNGNKGTKAVFFIGGGSQVPTLDEKLATKLQLPKTRVAVRGRRMLQNIEQLDNDPLEGPDGITVLGIGSVAFKKVGHNFITVIVNNKRYSLFNSQSITVANALALINYNPRELLPQNGCDLFFYLNGQKKQVYGELGRAAIISVNGKTANLQTRIKDNDMINVVKSLPGTNAKITLGELLATQNMQEKDSLIVNGEMKNNDYWIKDGDQIFCIDQKNLSTVRDKKLEVPMEKRKDFLPNGIGVLVNGEKIILKEGENSLLLDIFNYIDVSFKNHEGMVNITLNGIKAEYTAPLSEGDVIQILWQE